MQCNHTRGAASPPSPPSPPLPLSRSIPARRLHCSCRGGYVPAGRRPVLHARSAHIRRRSIHHRIRMHPAGPRPGPPCVPIAGTVSSPAHVYVLLCRPGPCLHWGGVGESHLCLSSPSPSRQHPLRRPSNIICSHVRCNNQHPHLPLA